MCSTSLSIFDTSDRSCRRPIEVAILDGAEEVAAADALATLRDVAEATVLDAGRDAWGVLQSVGRCAAVVNRREVGVAGPEEFCGIGVESGGKIFEVGDKDVDHAADTHVVRRLVGGAGLLVCAISSSEPGRGAIRAFISNHLFPWPSSKACSQSISTSSIQ